jgi:hypothetical protein
LLWEALLKGRGWSILITAFLYQWVGYKAPQLKNKKNNWKN